MQLPTLSILISSDAEIDSSQMASFSCFAVGFSPKDYTITWLRNDAKINERQIASSSEGETTKNGTLLYNAASYIKVAEHLWKDVGTVITCMFANGKGTVNASLTYNSGCDGE